jgi:hypothetical protein
MPGKGSGGQSGAEITQAENSDDGNGGAIATTTIAGSKTTAASKQAAKPFSRKTIRGSRREKRKAL